MNGAANANRSASDNHHHHDNVNKRTWPPEGVGRHAGRRSGGLLAGRWSGQSGAEAITTALASRFTPTNR